MIHLERRSALAVPAATVLAQALTMRGVNRELAPLLRMSYPSRAASLALADVPTGEVLFNSWILLGGVLPLDRHALCLERVHADGFDERSTSWLQRSWVHRRRVRAVPGGCEVSDVLEFEPRIGALAALLRAIVAATFAHRHRRLRAQFGALARPAS